MSADMIRCVINGRLVEMAPGATVADLKRAGGVAATDSLVSLQGQRAEVMADHLALKDGMRSRSISPYVEG